jgi:hypothetical protein
MSLARMKLSVDDVLLMDDLLQLDVRPISSSESEQEDAPAAEPKLEGENAARLKESLSALNAISRGLTKIQVQQKRDRHRLDLHSETNNSNYSSVFAGSIFETLVFIAVAIFQVSQLAVTVVCSL